VKKKKIYTKKGDDGTTHLFSGSRISKNHVRVKSYGKIDELNSWIGLIRTFKIDRETLNFLLKIQEDLFIIGSELSNDLSSNNHIVKLKKQNVEEIEAQIDKIDSKLPELKNFIIPGGNILVSYTHITRCVCRRAEQMISELSLKESVHELIIPYMNRLSDYFFILSRKFSIDFDVEEIKWISQKKQ